MASDPVILTSAPMIMSVKLFAPEKTSLLNVVTLAGIFTLVRGIISNCLIPYSINAVRNDNTGQLVVFKCKAFDRSNAIRNDNAGQLVFGKCLHINRSNTATND